jgi:hypothetical protein
MKYQAVRLLTYPNDPPSLLAGWMVPTHVELRDISLVYRPEESVHLTSPSPKNMDELLAEFVALHSSKDMGNSILNFARKRGVLGLCKHDRPTRHRSYADPSKGACPTVTQDGLCYESMLGWVNYSRVLAAINRAGTYVRGMAEKPIQPAPRRVEGDSESVDFIGPGHEWSVGLDELLLPGAIEDWALVNRFILDGGRPIMTPSALATNAQAARLLLAFAMIPLLREAGIYLNLAWSNSRQPRIFLSGQTNEYGHGGLLGALAIHTTLSLSLAKRLVKCQECPEFFPLKAGRRADASLCPTCRQRISHLEAVKRYVKRERRNPNRKKRTRLTPGQRALIIKALQTGKPGTPQRLAKRYGVSVRAIYKIGSSRQKPNAGAEGNERKEETA